MVIRFALTREARAGRLAMLQEDDVPLKDLSPETQARLMVHLKNAPEDEANEEDDRDSASERWALRLVSEDRTYQLSEIPEDTAAWDRLLANPPTGMSISTEYEASDSESGDGYTLSIEENYDPEGLMDPNEDPEEALDQLNALWRLEDGRNSPFSVRDVVKYLESLRGPGVNEEEEEA